MIRFIFLSFFVGLSLHEGKNIEKLLVGEVKHPIPESAYREQVLRYGIGNVRQKTLRLLHSEMQRARMDQAEKNPSNPKSHFGKNLLSDLDEAMGNLSDLEEGRYELRFYSAKDTMLDFAGSFDCWVEVYDLVDNKPLADFKIDVTTNPNKKAPAHLADTVLYCDTRYINDDIPGRIEKAFFTGPEYKSLVEMSSRLLKERARLPSPDNLSAGRQH
ncbi:hypothetical protein HZA44_04390 [Candidatus Peregrinibacteria bacterium]|nr:hypothetical protein [Candidatus Peregrinibacteria bacterium]